MKTPYKIFQYVKATLTCLLVVGSCLCSFAQQGSSFPATVLKRTMPTEPIERMEGTPAIADKKVNENKTEIKETISTTQVNTTEQKNAGIILRPLSEQNKPVYVYTKEDSVLIKEKRAALLKDKKTDTPK